MKIGDVVIHNKTKKKGMITWRKNNQEIGVNFSAYQIVMVKKDIVDKKDHLIRMGADDVFSKEELTLCSSL